MSLMIISEYRNSNERGIRIPLIRNLVLQIYHQTYDSVVNVQNVVRCQFPDNWRVENSTCCIRESRSCSTWECASRCSRKLPRKEVIQPHLPVRLPCYDFTPITDPTLDACLSRSELARRLQVLPTFVV